VSRPGEPGHDATSLALGAKVGPERGAEVGAPQCEINDSLEVPELVAGVVARSLHLIRVDRAGLQESFSAHW